MEYSSKHLTLVPVHKCVPLEVEQYWQDLAKKDLLVKRWYNRKDPKWKDVHGIILDIMSGRQQALMYMVYSKDEIIAEITLDNFMGKAAQTHFSIHPDLSYADTLAVSKDVVRILLTILYDPVTREPMVYSLFGITPLTFKSACILALKVGYKKMGVLPKAAHLVNEGGLYDDCQVATITVDDLIGG